ncbi:PREDICTED: zinc finger protein 385B-like [Priapulus caudatus]|uniref:Zinc finger protein 385B-like n=1 Tax=Priapulus caudatus TaxID=37621 RepID=A0ABM1DYC1_PRICU|nr:PREDICTED: zinc finger protein 385B-like [Priapulus caudatus]
MVVPVVSHIFYSGGSTYYVPPEGTLTAVPVIPQGALAPMGQLPSPFPPSAGAVCMSASGKIPGFPSPAQRPSFYHFCCICNSELNSCKQAIAHCNGKRHRRRQKKLINATGDSQGCSSGGSYPDMSCVSPTNCQFVPGSVATSGLNMTTPSFGNSQAAAAYVYNFTGSYGPPPAPAAPAGYSAPYNTCDTYFTTLTSPTPSGYYSAASYQGSGGGGSVSSYLSGLQTGASGSSQSLLSPASGSDGGSDSSRAGSADLQATCVDPVTKAVIDNVMGKKFAKKRAPSATCDVCHLSFNSGSQLDAHMTGAKHNKRLRSMKILVEKVGESVTANAIVQDGEQGKQVLCCDLCKISVNSPLQLQAHNSGTKHKQRTTGKEIKTEEGDECEDVAMSNAEKTNNENSSSDANTPSSTAPPSAIGSSNSVDATKFASPTNKAGKFFCQICDVTVNSEIQLQQHTASKRHQDKQAGRPGKPKFKPRFYSNRSKVEGGTKRCASPRLDLQTTFIKHDVML